MKDKSCKICREKFTPERQMQTVCSYTCSLEYGKLHFSTQAKEKKKQANREKRAFNQQDKTYLKELAQKVVNQYARLRDLKERGDICCTCGLIGGQKDGGHFLPTSGYSAIRYNTNQIHLQCKRCNRFNGGMPKEYRVFMINKYGLDYVKKLESTKSELSSYSTEYYQKLIRVVRKKMRRLSKKTL